VETEKVREMDALRLAGQRKDFVLYYSTDDERHHKRGMVADDIALCSP
jgi:hypothetical protein